MSSPAAALAAFDLKSTAWTLTVLRLHTAHLPALLAALDARFADTPGLFDGDAVVLDLGPLREADEVLDYDALLPALRRHGMLPVAVQGGSAAQTQLARAAGLPEALDAAAAPARSPSPAAARVPTVTDAVAALQAGTSAPLVVQEVIREVPTPVPTMVVDKPLRSGQRVYARGGDLVVLAVVSFGAEVIADGHIHVYAPLRGRAIAGARGDTSARIFSTCLEPQLVSVAGIYRTAENDWPAVVRARPAQVRLDGERLLVEPLQG